jgi:hypothetical protein
MISLYNSNNLTDYEVRYKNALVMHGNARGEGRGLVSNFSHKITALWRYAKVFFQMIME